MELHKREIRSVLIIDDDQDDYDLVVEAMQEVNPDVTVYYIKNCNEAQQYKHLHFDFILLDINMPQYDGFFWLKSIREKGYTDVPIVMYTNSHSPSNIEKAYEEGANLYFSKPESFKSLVQGFRKLMQMDWTNPYSITNSYSNSGHHNVFQYD